MAKLLLTPARYLGSPCRNCSNTIRHRSNGKCVLCAYAANQRNKKARKYTSRRQNEVRDEVINAMGAECRCCGETIREFLTIDHIQPLGDNKNRPHVYTIYRQVRAEGYPKRKYRVLCFNCNCGRARNGGTCPHKRLRK